MAIEKTVKAVNEVLTHNPTKFPVQPVALVILDVNMPNKNGLDAFKEINKFYEQITFPLGMKKIEEFVKKPRFIMMSGFKGTELDRLLKQLQADEFVSNPLDDYGYRRIVQLYREATI